VAGYEDLLEFSLETETLSPELAGRLRRLARERPGDADAAVAAARGMRSVLDCAFRPLTGDKDASERALEDLGRLGATATARGRLVAVEGGFEWSWEHAGDDLETPLWPVAHAALELITGGPLARLGSCGRCGYLFLDRTKNHSRRWCSMGQCGTSEKIERYVARRRERRAGSVAAG
jgi:predicted RNA-binding Zn ribbon-like protein